MGHGLPLVPLPLADLPRDLTLLAIVRRALLLVDLGRSIDDCLVDQRSERIRLLLVLALVDLILQVFLRFFLLLSAHSVDFGVSLEFLLDVTGVHLVEPKVL